MFHCSSITNTIRKFIPFADRQHSTVSFIYSAERNFKGKIFNSHEQSLLRVRAYKVHEHIFIFNFN